VLPFPPSYLSHSLDTDQQARETKQIAQRVAGDERRGANAPVSWLAIKLDSAAATEEYKGFL
jgi:hypothetical protein